MAGTCSAPPWVLGYDPGRHGGAATLLDHDLRARVVWAWRSRTRGGEPCFQVATLRADGEWAPALAMCPTLGVVGDTVARQAAATTGASRWRVWCEASHLHGAKSPLTAIRLGQITGALIGPVERYADGRRIPQVQASEWRHKLLGLPIRTPREQAKGASLALMPNRIPGIRDALHALARAYNVAVDTLDHVTDSAGVAEYAARFGG